MPVLLMRLLASRIGPYLGRLAKASPGLEARLVTALRNAGAAAGKTISSITAYAQKSPINMALLVTTLASIGVDVSSWFTPDELAGDTESAAFVRQLGNVQASSNVTDVVPVSRNPAVSNDLTSISDLTVSYRPGLADKESALATMQAASTWARQFFGSREAADVGLKMLDVLLSTPAADRAAALRYLR